MNGFDDLERQLRHKVAGRVRRPRDAMLRAAMIAVCTLASAGTVAAAATGVIGRTILSGSDRVSPVEKLLTDILHAAEKTPGCALHGPDRRRAQLSAVPAEAATIRAFPQLQRRPSAYERAVARRYGGAGGATQVLSGGARELRATDGTRFLLIVTAGRGATSGMGGDPRCIAIQRGELERRAPDIEPAVLAQARQSLDRAEANSRANLGREGLLLVQLADNGRMAGLLGTYSDVAIRRGTGFTGRTITGLVPAPADHVVLRPRLGGAKPIRVDVPQRVFHQALPEAFGNRITVEWHARDGRLLHTLNMGH